MTTATSKPSLHPLRRPDNEDDDNRFYDRVAFASDNPIPWFIGRLKLGKCDLGRMNTTGVPVLRSHNGDKPVGAVLKVERSGGLWRSNWRLPKIPANQDSFDQMDAAILRGVSVGGSLVFSTLELIEDDPDDPDGMVFQCDWILVEQSLTPIPADVTSGVDREAVDALARSSVFDTIISDGAITTRESPALQRQIDSAVSRHRELQELRRKEGAMTTAQQIQDIPQELIERAIATQLERSESLKALTQLPGEIAKLTANLDAEAQANMEYRAKLDRLQFGGSSVLQLNNWQPGVNRAIDLGKVLRLTLTDDIGLPAIDRSADTSLEESVIERAELRTPGRNVVGRIPWAALAAREEQLALQRAAMSDGAGARPLDIDIIGNGGLLLSSFSPIMSRMDVRFGVEGAQKAPWATAQMTAAAATEGADIPVTNLTLNNVEYLPKSIASAYEITSSLRAVDDGVFTTIAMMAINDILMDQVTGQVLVGGGANQISGLWGTANIPNVDYGAAPANFDRDDVIDWFDHVRLAKTDGGAYTCVMGDSLWKLAEKTPRGLSGTSSAGFTNVDMYLLEMTGEHMGMIEGVEAFHYADFAPTGINEPGLMFKANRVVVWFWGDSLTLEWVPQLARKDVYKMCAEVNMEVFRPAQNVARIKRT